MHITHADTWLAQGARMRAIHRPHVVVCLVLLATHVTLLGWSATQHSPTVDEVAYLPAGLSHWQLGRFELYRANPPLVRVVAAIPVLLADPATNWERLREWPGARPEFDVGEDFIAANGAIALWYFTIARWAVIPFSILGACICFSWARDLYGESAGLLAAVLWCFSPNVLGNAQTIMPDTGATSLGLAASYAFWHWLRAPSLRISILTGILLGLAQLSKMTWLILFPLWPLVWLIHRSLLFRCARRRTPDVSAGYSRHDRTITSLERFDRLPSAALPFRFRSEASQLGGILLLGLVVLNAGYEFDNTFQRLGDFRFVSETLAGPPDARRGGRWGNRFSDTCLAGLPAPVPEQYLLGLDTAKSAFEIRRPAYIAGRLRDHGCWYYYLYALAVKVPLGTWLLLGCAALVPTRVHRTALCDALALTATPILVLVMISANTGINRHLRYLLPIFPFAFIYIARLGAGLRLVSRRTAVLSLALAWSVGSSLSIFPHSLSYFNELAGGPANGHAHLLGSNIDYGQDLLFLKEWLDANPQATRLQVIYYGRVDPRVAGIECDTASSPARSGLPAPHAFPQPGWYAISVSALRGETLPANTCGSRDNEAYARNRYSPFLRLPPIGMAGYSIYIYHVTPDAAKRLHSRHDRPHRGPGTLSANR